MEAMFEEYWRYRWFFTSSGKLVVGGKNAEQNDELLKRIKALNKDFIVVHTKEPGSPFSAIISDIERIDDKDLEECAIFTACFSKAWKNKKKKSEVDIFKASSLYKNNGMKTGTWGIISDMKRMKVELKLALAKQEGVLRAVPLNTGRNSKDEIILTPGKIDKPQLAKSIKSELGIELNEKELLSAVPAGGFKIVR